MSKVQEIEAALSQLPPKDFQSVERWMAEFKKRRKLKAPAAPPAAGYDITAAELERFDARMKKEIQADRRQGKLREFSGDLEKDLKD